MSTLEPVVGTAATLVVGAALVAGVLTLAATRRPPLALGVLLDLLVAAGLLRLVGDPSWQALVTAAAIVVLRRLIGASLRSARRSWSGRADDEPAPPPSGRVRLPSVEHLVRPAWRR
ncbi:hypothetical protein ACI78V_16505 [Geodermatophilus sp. SYSU D00742]